MAEDKLSAQPLRIAIWLTPDVESHLSLKEIGEAFGNPYNTQYCRVVLYGIDDDLSFYPGPIPIRLRGGGKKVERTKQAMPKNRLSPPAEDIDPVMARLFVLRMIMRAKEDFEKSQCQKARAFLLDEEGRLTYYLELMYDELVCQNYLLALVEFVKGVENVQPLLKPPKALRDSIVCTAPVTSLRD